MGESSSVNIEAQVARLHSKNKQVGGFSNYCCVPGCKSAFDNKAREINKWVNVLKHVRRKSGADSFNPNEPFKDDIRITWGAGKKKLNLGQ